MEHVKEKPAPEPASPRNRARKRLGEVLIEAGLIAPETLHRILREIGPDRKQPIGAHLVAHGFITEADLAQSLAKQNRLPYVDLRKEEIDPEVARLVGERLARQYKFLPLYERDGAITVALSDPSFTFVLDTLRLKTGLKMRPCIAGESDLLEAIDGVFAPTGTELADILASAGENMEVVSDHVDDEDVDAEEADQAPVIKLVDHYVVHALRSRASDIHIEPRERDMRVRFRIDGILHEMTPPPKRFQNAMLSRLKIMSDLDISERRRPQDGRFKVRDAGRIVDFRVSSLPTVNGEKIVIRILDRGNLKLDLSCLGFTREELDVFERAIRRPYGMVLVTGPTGSGKTTTLYSALSTIASPERNVVTVEDPVEYRLDEVNQVQTHSEIGFSFPEGLRSILRQDPDVIMIGEIRDLETAEIAIKSALTGHLVLSTLHTNDAASTLVRLTNMGVPGYLVTASVVLVVAQRLTRRVCPECRRAFQPDSTMLDNLGLPAGEYRFYEAVGCRNCNSTGYHGRVAIYELLEMSPHIKRCITSGMDSQQIAEETRRQGIKTLRDAGLQKVIDGVTTVEEVLRVTFDNEEIVHHPPASGTAGGDGD